MKIGDRRRWWNRSVPIGRILLGLAAVAVLWLNWDALVDLTWGVRHHWTAQVRGDDMKVPFMWRVVPGSYNWNELRLERARWWRIWRLEHMDVDFRQVRQPKTLEAQSLRAESNRRLDELDNSEARWSPNSVQDTFVGGPVDGSEYRCLHVPLAAGMASVRCRSEDDAVFATMLGPSGEPKDWTDLQQVLRAFADAKYHRAEP